MTDRDWAMAVAVVLLVLRCAWLEHRLRVQGEIIWKLFNAEDDNDSRPKPT